MRAELERVDVLHSEITAGKGHNKAKSIVNMLYTARLGNGQTDMESLPWTDDRIW